MPIHPLTLPPNLAADEDRRLTRKQTAEFLGVSTATLERWSRLGTLRPIETGANMSWYRLGDVRARARGDCEPAVAA
jgi:predicted site-specific integrase-resolvase